MVDQDNETYTVLRTDSWQQLSSCCFVLEDVLPQSCVYLHALLSDADDVSESKALENKPGSHPLFRRSRCWSLVYSVESADPMRSTVAASQSSACI